MKKLKQKSNANPVGAGLAPAQNKGITLIALIITIIVMLILVGVAINVALNGGLFTKASEASKQMQVEADRETLLSAVVAAIGYDGKVVLEDIELPTGWTGTNGTYTSPKGNTFAVDENGKITEGENGGNEEAKKIEAALNRYFQAQRAENEEEWKAAAEELEQYGMIGISDAMESQLAIKFNLMFTSKYIKGEGENTYVYLIKKGYLYTMKNVVDGVLPEFKYVEPGTDEESEELLEKVLGLKEHLESKVVGQKVEDIMAKYDANELEEYLLDGYEIDLYEIYMYDDGELALRTNDLFPNTSITAFSEDGVTYSFVSTVTYN